MKIIAPMAGQGQRFIDVGYKDPKPLIKVGGKRIIEYISEMFNEDDQFVFVCNDAHLENTDMRDVLLSLRPEAAIVSMPPHKKGPVFTVQQAYDFIDDDEEVIVCYCDNPLVWSYEHFKNFVRRAEMDGCVLTHSGFHPHTLANTKMAFVKDIPGTCLFSEIKEKECYTDNPLDEHASTGAYYFRKGSMVKKYFDLAVEQDLSYKGEFYTTLVYNLLIQDGLKVGFYDTPFATVFGTPEEVKNFEAWKTILNGGQVKNEKDLKCCYYYWKAYHENKS